MDDGGFADRKDSEWVRNVKFVKKKPMVDLKTEQNDKIDTLTDKPTPAKVNRTTKRKKSNKLMFKRSKKESIGRQNSAVNDIQNTTEPPDMYHNSKPMRSTRPMAVHEYGPDVNGYKFIAFSEQEIPEPKVEVPIESENAEPECDDGIYNDDFDDEYNYKIYTTLWNDIEKGISCETLPLPVLSNCFEDLNEKNILAFLNEKSRLKVERIRWHPDKMRSLLIGNNMWYPVIESKVTQVFQLINRVYETI